MLLTQLPRTAKIIVIVGVTLVFLLFLRVLDERPLSLPHYGAADPARPGATGNEIEDGQSSSLGSEMLPCQTLPGAEDILVVMRTGASEIKDKLPIHESTTFRCYNDLVIFSDYEETFGGREVHNVLSDMPQQIVNTHMDFNYYRKIQAGRESLDVSELSGNISAESGPFGKTDNAGWRLDKWKFLPMINRTLDMYPEKKWYLFVEPDTYVVWSNMLQWIQELDPTKAAYYGSEAMIGEDLFAHGGSAFLLAKSTLEKGVQLYRSQATVYHELTANHWAGDCVLGILLKDAGVSLTWSWPMFQGGNPSDQMQFQLKKGGKKALWCNPALSYHHMIPDETAAMWVFEQDWIQRVQSRNPSRWPSLSIWGHDYSSVLHHREVFKQFVRPKLSSERMNWTNSPESYHPGTETATVEECRARCEANLTCLQYALGPAGCFTGAEPRIGRAQEGLLSGWMTERLDKWMKKLDHCYGKEGWTVT